MIKETYNYTDTADGFNNNELGSLIGASGFVTAFSGLELLETTFNVMCESVVDKPALDSLIASFEDVPLSKYIQNRIDEHDAKTAYLAVTAGFSFGGKTFSTSQMAQFQWDVLKNNKSSFTFPKELSTKDNLGYSIIESDVDAFWAAAKDVVDPIITAGRDLNKAVAICTTKAEVDAIIDAR